MEWGNPTLLAVSPESFKSLSYFEQLFLILLLNLVAELAQLISKDFLFFMVISGQSKSGSKKFANNIESDPFEMMKLLGYLLKKVSGIR